MSFRLKLIYFLVHHHGMTNKEAKKLIADGRITAGDKMATENILLTDETTLAIDGRPVRTPVKKEIILFYKPRGFESTMSAKVRYNLADFFPGRSGLIVAGRLDKDSEGLLLLSNDGKWVETICNPVSEKEKEYVVTLDRKPDDEFLEKFRSGVQLGNCLTKPCICTLADHHTIKVVLTEGKNRQIRRMCHKLGFGILMLKRTRIDRFELADLKPGEWRTAS